MKFDVTFILYCLSCHCLHGGHSIEDRGCTRILNQFFTSYRRGMNELKNYFVPLYFINYRGQPSSDPSKTPQANALVYPNDIHQTSNYIFGSTTSDVVRWFPWYVNTCYVQRHFFYSYFGVSILLLFY